MAKAENMLQTGHAGRLTWIKPAQMIQSLLCEAPASSLQCNKGAVHRRQKSSCARDQAAIITAKSWQTDTGGRAALRCLIQFVPIAMRELSLRFPAQVTVPSLSVSRSVAQPVDRNVTVNGLPIHYLEWGSGGKQPLILLHGIARVAHTFDHLAPHFSGNYHVIAVDMRGHGDSGWDPQGAYLVEDYVGDIEGLVAQLQLRNIVLWGNSTGGRVAQVFAGSHPELVSAVIVEDVGPERPAAISNRRAHRMSLEEQGWASVDELFAQVKIDYPRTAEPVLRGFVQHGSKPNADGRIVWKRDPAILNGFVPTELWAIVREIKAPIIYILGGGSTIVPPETQEQLRRALPQAEIVTMPGLGHYPSDEEPGDFLAIVDRFLAPLRGGRFA